MKPQLQKTNSEIDNLLEQSFLSKKNLEQPDDTYSDIKDDKIVFLLENNLLSQIGKLESIGYMLSPEHKKQYHQKLLENIINNPEDTIRQYLKQDIELPGKFLNICFLVDMQKDKDNFGLKKTIISFMDKVKKGLETDPVAKYKEEKLKDKTFVKQIFDVWYNSSIQHFEDIKTHVVNKKKFLWFYLNKSKSAMTKDIHKFNDNILQKHIVNHDNYFLIPVMNFFFLQSVGPENLTKVKDIIKMHDEVYNMLESSTSNMHTSTTRAWCHHIKIAEIELSNVVIVELDKQLKSYYEQEGNIMIKGIEDSKEYTQDNSHDKINSNLVKSLDKKVVKELPIEATKIIELIKNIGDKLLHKPIDEPTKENIEILCEEKLLEVVKKYLNIDKNYRHNLKNVQGKTAEELMVESLHIIRDNLILIEKEINEEKLKDLSINNRYLKKSLKN